tara:strand:- start:39 stop:317 length:279 start_codon:yes stop_codon:yes gene_type:complete
LTPFKLNTMAKVYIGYVGDRKTYDSGIVKYPITYKPEQLDELKKYITGAQRINVDFVIKQDGTAFLSVFDPNDPENQKYMKKKEEVKEDLPF